MESKIGKHRNQEGGFVMIPEEHTTHNWTLGGKVSLSPPIDLQGYNRIRASTATTASGNAMTGFRSISRIWGKSPTSWDSR